MATLLATLSGCGGGSGSKGPVDPDSLDFCLQWANGVCRLAYLCVDTAEQDAAFHARYGTSADTCFQALEKRCTSNQTGAQAFGPSCGPGKAVNQTAAATCTDNLDSASCVSWMAAPSGSCEGVCGAAMPMDASAGADVGTGADASTGGLATAVQFCNTEGSLICDRSFECDPAGSAATFGNLAGCKATLAAICGSGDPCPGGYTQNLASGCVTATRAATCQELMGPSPTICTNACL